MEEILGTIRNLLAALADPARIGPLVMAALLLTAGYLLARTARFAVLRALKHLAPQQLMLIGRAVYLTVFLLFAVSALRQLGFEFGVLLGAAGIVTVAIGFASQTSASNVISGLFLVLERAVLVGDIVRVGQTTGEVLSIDLLSTKLRTFDNLQVRIPNETMVKAEITTLNRFPIRRVDMMVGVAYKEDLSRVRKILMEVADKNPVCMDEPAPMLISQGFGESSIDFQFSVWAKSERFLELRNSIHAGVKAAFDREGIEIPFPHRSLYSGAAMDPLPIRLVQEEPAERSEPEPEPEPPPAGEAEAPETPEPNIERDGPSNEPPVGATPDRGQTP